MAQSAARQQTREAVDRLGAKQTGSRVFRAEVLDRLRRVVGFDWYAWVLTDPGTTVGVDPLAQLPDLTLLPLVVRLKYLTTINRWTSLDGVSVLGDRVRDSPLWREVQHSYGVVDVASVVFRDRFGCWGFLDLWSQRAYAAEDVALLRQLAPTLTAALRVRQARTFTVVAAAPNQFKPGPVVLLLRDDLNIVGQTGASQEWLNRLLPQPGGVAPIPACAYNVAAQLLARQHGVDGHEAMARIHLDDGFWVTLRASRVEPSDLIAVTIEPTSPGDRLDVFTRANGLSGRERELLTLLAQGADTVEAASRMSLSPHTVQDHLKSVFTKTVPTIAACCSPTPSAYVATGEARHPATTTGDRPHRRPPRGSGESDRGRTTRNARPCGSPKSELRWPTRGERRMVSCIGVNSERSDAPA